MNDGIETTLKVEFEEGDGSNATTMLRQLWARGKEVGHLHVLRQVIQLWALGGMVA